ncbi:hypothetical protein HmCmsJML131_03897 [Escherichia coli]|uniref:Uncharacterized protein n=1 Tax=Escherichia coli TaxID=562 RepID=A0A4C7BFE5_ECOLX|nr:hypothetical protein HmCmsJML131_03897 [Escherichia coli]
MVILNKFNFAAYSFLKNLLVKALKKETTLITKNFRFKNQYIWNFCFNYIHFINNL